MSGSDENPRRTRHATDGETMAAPRDAGASRRRRGRRAPTNFEQEMRTMAASVRQLAQHQFRVPKITPYTGKGDPLDHVNTYKTEMSLRGATPALKCRAFHLTLSGGAKRWYNKLAAGSIRNWPDLKRTFINYFSS
ncbi:Retrotrans gag domain-containing protein [Abeliophyllum distichum]|uniref:Retrotrans gag domain-containing protein n=1 Tax=Abeliophyllum distichum TaxID=126358 RepID=A0ABD1V300_9LAMI